MRRNCSESISSFNKVLSIKLDTAVIVPAVLKDIQPPKSSSLKALDVVISSITGGSTAGKFYKGENAPALISTLRVEGSCARIALQEDATEGQKADYERFQAHLQAGHLVSLFMSLTTKLSNSCDISSLSHLDSQPLPCARRKIKTYALDSAFHQN